MSEFSLHIGHETRDYKTRDFPPFKGGQGGFKGPVSRSPVSRVK